MTDEQHEINDLADELDRMLPPGRNDAPQGDSNPVLDAAVRLANAPRPPMPPDMMARIQAKVVETHRQQMRAKPRPRVTSYTRYLAAASIVMVLFFAGFIPAMAGSVPGDLLYPVKTGLESVELALATSDEAQVRVYLTHAERRTEEAHILLARGTFEESLFTRALDSMLDSAESARLHPDLPALDALGTRMAALNTGLDAVLLEAQTRQLASPTVLAALSESLDTVRENGDLLLTETSSPPAESTPEVVETDAPTATLTPTATPSSTPTPTSTFTDLPTATFTLTPTATPSSTLTPTTEVTTELTAEVTESAESATTSMTPPITAIIRASGPVNVRNGPGVEYVVIATLQPGVSVPLLGWNADGTWLHIQLEDGRRGWIASTLSNLYDLASPSATSESGSQGNGGQGNDGGQGQGGNFGCEHPGNYCNAPGQTGDNPGQGQGQGSGQGQGGGKP